MNQVLIRKLLGINTEILIPEQILSSIWCKTFFEHLLKIFFAPWKLTTSCVVADTVCIATSRVCFATYTVCFETYTVCIAANMMCIATNTVCFAANIVCSEANILTFLSGNISTIINMKYMLKMANTLTFLSENIWTFTSMKMITFNTPVIECS